MKKIGFFGGCFNPVTNIHITIAYDLIKHGEVDEVIFIPVNDFYKKKGLVNEKHRYKMLKLAIQGYNKMQVDDVEIKENRKLYAVDIFEIIKNIYKEAEIFMIMGSDNFEKMSRWKGYDKIKNDYKYIVIKRDKTAISSTKIREMIKNDDENVKEYLGKEVYEYITKNKLYMS